MIFIQGTIVYKIHFRQVPNFIQYLNNKQLKQGNKQKEINKRKEIKKKKQTKQNKKTHIFKDAWNSLPGTYNPNFSH